MTIPEFLLAILLAVMPPCAVEDDLWCSWDAQTQGDGYGTSFVDIAGVALRAPQR